MFKDLKTQTHLKPGQRGTKKLVARYGDALLCVRYRYDKARGVRVKTVELVVEEKVWPNPPLPGFAEIVQVAVGYPEKGLRDLLKSAGGKWDPEEKVWHVAYGSIRGTELEKRILRD
jgi:hypothetical protein